MKRVYPIEDICMGCRLCEVACLVEHSRSKDPVKAYRKEQPRAAARNLVEEEGPVTLSVACRHCQDAPCLEACITGAMQRTESGAVAVDRERCVGCWMCLMVCPYGAISREAVGQALSPIGNRQSPIGEPTVGRGFHAPPAAGPDTLPTSRSVAGKCDLCPGREVPACVEICPNRALLFQER